MRRMSWRRHNHNIASLCQRHVFFEWPVATLLKLNWLGAEPLRPMMREVTHHFTKSSRRAFDFSARGKEPRCQRKVPQAIDMIRVQVRQDNCSNIFRSNPLFL